MSQENTEKLGRIVAHLDQRLPDVFNANIRVKPVKDQGRPTDDATIKLLAVDKQDCPVAYLMVGTPLGDNLVVHGLKRAEMVRNVCGADLGRAILSPLVTGVVDQYDYVIYPFCRVLPRSGVLEFYHRLKLRRPLLEWLKRVTERTKTNALLPDESDSFRECLEYLESCMLIPERLRRDASKAKARILDHEWIPRHVLTHTDLWLGNVLLTPEDRDDIGWPGMGPRFVIIDWPGAIEKGYAFFDLIRISWSLRLSRYALRKEVAAHCQMLACELTDSKSYLLASLGYIGLHLEHFPVEHYLSLCEECVTYLDAAVSE